MMMFFIICELFVLVFGLSASSLCLLCTWLLLLVVVYVPLLLLLSLLLLDWWVGKCMDLHLIELIELIELNGLGKWTGDTG